jgi:hypothetical protein
MPNHRLEAIGDDRRANASAVMFGRQRRVTHESRHALSRARYFLEKARSCPADARVDFEAFLEASIVFARAAVHRLKAKYEGNSGWKTVWASWATEPAVEFFRKERDWILKEAPPRIGQKAFAGPVSPSMAEDFYYYDDPETPAAVTVERRLAELADLLAAAEQRFLA